MGFISMEFISHWIGLGKPDDKRRFRKACERWFRPSRPTNGKEFRFICCSPPSFELSYTESNDFCFFAMSDGSDGTFSMGSKFLDFR